MCEYYFKLNTVAWGLLPYHTRVLDPARKQALTSEFLRDHGTEELDGFRFANARASLPQVYSSAYDEFLIFSS
jgi:hypothetical protein